MKITGIKQFFDPSDETIEKGIAELERQGFTVLAVNSCIAADGGFTWVFQTLVYGKEEE